MYLPKFIRSYFEKKKAFASDIELYDNTFWHGTAYMDDNSVWDGNVFHYVKLIPQGNAKIYNTTVYQGEIDVKEITDGYLFVKNMHIEDASIIVRTNQYEVYIEDLYLKNTSATLYGGDNVRYENIVSDGAEVNVMGNYLNGLKTPGYVSVWYTPEDNETVKYNDWVLNGTGANIRFRSSAQPLGGFEFNNLHIKTNNIAQFDRAIDVDANLGSLVLKNSSITAESATANVLINFDNTVSVFRAINSEFKTGVGVNLLDIGTSTETSSWLYMNNIFTGVNLNNTTGTELNNFEE